jgi:hypothetical protein
MCFMGKVTAVGVEFPAGSEYVTEPRSFTACLTCHEELLIVHVICAGY